MNAVEQSGSRSGFVPLKMPDQMPYDSGTVPNGDSPQRLLLFPGLLDAVLADLLNPAGDCLPDPVDGDSLGNGDQPDLGRIPARRLGRRGDPFLHPLHVLADHGTIII